MNVLIWITIFFLQTFGGEKNYGTQGIVLQLEEKEERNASLKRG